MLDWLRHEVLVVNKEAELRIRDATTFVTDYARGHIPAQEAQERFLAYGDRWGDALSGVQSIEGRTDDDILREMDDERRARLSKTPSR